MFSRSCGGQNRTKKVLTSVAGKPLDRLSVSIVTFAEIRFGIESVADATRCAELNDWLTHKVRPMFDESALPVSEDVMFKWRLLVADGRKTDHTGSKPELIIAATGSRSSPATRGISKRRGCRSSILGTRPMSAKGSHRLQKLDLQNTCGPEEAFT